MVGVGDGGVAVDINAELLFFLIHFDMLVHFILS